jgi:hypothetical protein
MCHTTVALTSAQRNQSRLGALHSLICVFLAVSCLPRWSAPPQNYGIFSTTPLFMRIVVTASVPASFVVDYLVFGETSSVLKIGGAVVILVGFFAFNFAAERALDQSPPSVVELSADTAPAQGGEQECEHEPECDTEREHDLVASFHEEQTSLARQDTGE